MRRISRYHCSISSQAIEHQQRSASHARTNAYYLPSDRPAASCDTTVYATVVDSSYDVYRRMQKCNIVHQCAHMRLLCCLSFRP
eukprot:scaffold247180_cov43-Prasinocladus_malaysianus.AAC.2